MDLAICWDSVIFFTSPPTPADASRPRRPRQGVGPGIESKRTTRATSGFQVCASRSPRSRGIAIPKTGPSARKFAAFGPPPCAADPGTRVALREDDVAFASVETATSYVHRGPSGGRSPKLYPSRSCRKTAPSARTYAAFRAAPVRGAARGPLLSEGALRENDPAYAPVETAPSYVHRGPSGGRSPKLYLSRSCRNSYQGAGTQSFFSPRRRHPPTRPGRAGPVRVSDQASSRRGRRGLRLGAKYAHLSLLEFE